MDEDDSFVKNIQENTKRFRNKMTAAGFKIGGDDHPICPGRIFRSFFNPVMPKVPSLPSVHMGDAKLAADFAEDMLAEGVYVIGFSYPVVPKGKARIRVQISAGHTKEDIDQTVESFVKVAKTRGVL